MILLFHVCQSCFWVSIEMFVSFVIVHWIAFKPFIEPHCAHDVVIRHGIETIKSVLNFLLWTNSRLEASCCSSLWVSIPIQDFIWIETPWIKDKVIYIFRFNKVVFQFKLIEVEYLKLAISITLLVIRNQSLSCCFSQTASVLNLYSLSYSDQSLPKAYQIFYPMYWKYNLQAF